MREVLLYFSFYHHGDWKKIYQSIEQKEPIDMDQLVIYKQQLTCSYITILDKEYPDGLKQAFCPPYILYYIGDLNLLHHSSKVAIIGSRQHTGYGEKMARKLASEFCQHQHVVVSGAAKGIDAIAHQTTLQNQGNTIAVVGNGLDCYYPKENSQLIQQIEKEGLVISEYPPGTMPQKYFFPARNRLIAALSEAIIVIEAKAKSGTLITVRNALDDGKDIYCVPYPADEKSVCNELIKQGAILIESYEDFRNEKRYVINNIQKNQ